MSFRLSPLLTEDPFATKFMTSADNLFAAVSKLILVRVESSKNRFTIVFPLKVGSFLFGPSVMAANSFAVESRFKASSFDRSAADRRWPEII